MSRSARQVSGLRRTVAAACVPALTAAFFCALPGSAGAAALRDTTAVAAPAAAFSEPIAAATDEGTIRVLVGLQVRYDGATTQTAAGADAVSADLADARARLYAALVGQKYTVARTYSLLPYVALDMSPSALRALRTSGAAASIHEQRALKTQATYQPGLIEATTEAARGTTGLGQTLAVIDNGVDATIPFLAGRVVGEACFSGISTCPNGQTTQTGTGAAAPTDGEAADFHGTAVAGVAAGAQYTGIDFDGIAPGASIYAIKDGNSQLSFTPDVLASLNHVIVKRSQGVNIGAVVLSQGTDTEPDTGTDCDLDDNNQAEPLKAPIDALRAAGVPTVIAAGNSGTATTATNSVHYPACVSSAITVGATTQPDAAGTEEWAVFSDSSPQVEILAPGKSIDVATPSYYGVPFFPASGTSFAAPAVAGAWLLYQQRYPGSSVDEVLAALKQTGKPITDARNGLTRERINIAAAVGRWGFVVADQPSTASYTPASTLRGNSAGGVNTVTRSAVGTYAVAMPKLGSAIQGNIQVKEYGTTANRCNSSSLGGLVSGSQTTARISVKCYTPAGALADTKFVAQYEVTEQKTTKKRGYATPTSLSSPSYVLSPDRYSSFTAAEDYYVERSATGRYFVHFTDFVNSNGTPQVSAINSGSAYCRLTGWVNDTVSVSCRNTSGAYVDSVFAVSFNDQAVVTGRRGAYIFANNATSTTAYTPGSTYAWNSQAGVTTSRKTATGTYSVVLGSLAAANAAPLVTAVNTSAGLVACRPESWTGTTSTTVVVKCTNAAGAAVDSQFTLSYATSVGL